MRLLVIATYREAEVEAGRPLARAIEELNRQRLARTISLLKRHGFPRDQIHELRQAYRMLFSSEGTLMERLEDVENMFASNPLVRQITEFIKSHSDRSFCVPNNNVPAPSQS